MPKSAKVHRRKGDRRDAWGHTESAAERGYGDDWRKLRDQYIQMHPLCERCEIQGRVTEAVQVDHRVPFAGIHDPRRLEWSNLESVCLSCHRIREHERKRGQS